MSYADFKEFFIYVGCTWTPSPHPPKKKKNTRADEDEGAAVGLDGQDEIIVMPLTWFLRMDKDQIHPHFLNPSSTRQTGSKDI